MRKIWLGVLIGGLSIAAAGQSPSGGNNQAPPTSQTENTTQNGSQGATAPAPAFGQSAPILSPENPPLSGLDEPSLEMRVANRSFVSAAIQVGESGDSNANNALGGSRGQAVSHVLGAGDLQKFWPRSDLFLEYLGGVVTSDDRDFVRQMQALGLEAVTRWRTGQATLRDGASYLPDGSFSASSAGGLPGFGIATGHLGLGLPGIFHLEEASVGTIPRFSNVASLDVVQAITPRSAFTVVGAFANDHFYHNEGDQLINGDETTVEGGWSHLVSRHDQMAVVYAFQLFRFPLSEGGEIYNNIINIRYSHVISGRMSFIAEAGPQYTDLRFSGSHIRWSPTGRGVLRYRFPRTFLTASYEKFLSQGSGFFAGASAQIAEFTARRPLGRTYELLLETGYSREKRLAQTGGISSEASVFNQGFGGAVLRKHLGRSWDALAAYRFSVINFDNPVTIQGSTGKTNHRMIGTVAIEWHPKPVRVE
ncbi:MAG TPA: hypothetical protein VMT67_03305 [Terriglobales bacterium]|nr:hypothetical protein [Terriglobales bacterium]